MLGALQTRTITDETTRLFAPAKDLDSVLATFNYSLYLLAYLDAKSAPLKAKALAIVTHEATKSSLSEPLYPEASPFAKLGSIVYKARATLRLFGLFPIIVKARQLLKGPSKGADPLMHTMALVQCTLYGAFQFLENIAFLTEHGVFSKRLTARWATDVGSSAKALYRTAHRAWFLSILCDFMRVFRMGQLVISAGHVGEAAEKSQGTMSAARRAVHSIPAWVRPLAWLTIGWQLSGWTEDGIPGFNMGIRGTAGVLANIGRTMVLWDATSDVIADV